MTRLSPEQIYGVALQAGFPPDRAVVFTAIALAESRGVATANAAGAEDSRGLWQINVGAHGDRFGDLYDPLTNARAALEVSRGGTDITPWSVTHARHAGTQQDYRTWLDEAQAAAAAVGTGGGAAAPAAGGATEAFVQAALAQVGDRYVFGHNVQLDDPDPRAFDCSELVEWAAHRAGVQIQDGTWNQYLQLQGENALIDVEEAIRTRGALLFHFSSTPTAGGGRPRQAHVAISLGDGRIVEAANPGRGVVISPADPDRFNHAAVIPALGTATPPPATTAAVGADQAAFAVDFEALPPPADADSDGLTDEFERLLGTDPQDVDSDDDDLSDAFESTRSHTDPMAADTDADAVPDGVEVAEGSDPGRHRLPDEVVAAGFGGAATADTDDDGLSDLFEQQIGSNRDEADTDVDGVPDDIEHALGSDLLSIDTDRDGLTDGVAFDMGILGPRLPPATAPGTGVPVDPSGADAPAGSSDPTAADPDPGIL
jgi:cell wall-associated NlpC family hydrolase